MNGKSLRSDAENEDYARIYHGHCKGLKEFSLGKLLPGNYVQIVLILRCKQNSCTAHNRNAITVIFSVALFSE